MIRVVSICLCLCLSLSLSPSAPLKAQQVPDSPAQIQFSFAPLVRQAAPAVVNIYARRVVAARQSPFRRDPFFERFFRDFAAPRPRVQNSLGSGVILSADGVAVSNYHVVGDATEIRVVLNDRREFAARVLLADEESDLAILQLDGARDMPHLDLRDSENVQVGELVLAIGNPFGVGQTVSSGIVSGLARSGTATGSARGYFLQTDAPINPGNSGGALIDVAGRLIGVNTSILTRSGGSNGIGFAIPSNLVAQFVEQARAGRDAFQRPWAGVVGQPVTADLADGLGMSVPGGVVLSQLHPASPFAEAGLRPGDVILAVDGKDVNTPAEVIYHMAVRGVGRSVVIDRLRDGAADRVTVALIDPPELPPRDALTVPRSAPLAGMRIANANPALITELSLPPNLSGVIVTDPGPVGARLGLQAGDRLIAINDREIARPADVPLALAAASRNLTLLAERGGRRLSFRFRL